MAFKVENPDYDLSPFTGMTRYHWLESGKFLLDGVFRNLKQFNDPLVFPKQSNLCYPQPDHPEHKHKCEEFEGLARTFMMAAPIINEDPNLKLNGFSVKEYYANQVLLATDAKSPRFVGKLSEIIQKYGLTSYQQTAEGAALAVSLIYSASQIWDVYSQKQKDQVALLFSDFAHNRTSGHNWRFFSVMLLTFLKLNGYPIDETILKDHLQHLMAFYAGDGWYRDDSRFDFYNPWAFHLYGPLWCVWYGYEYEPEIAAIIEKRNNEFMKTYPLMFSRDGHQLMWGRSIIYRCAASSAFGATFLLKKTSMDPGWARRIASGNILQFLTRDDTFRNNIPCIGYYRPFDPLVQSYSCAASPFWMSKVYVALTLPKDSPFWTAKENIGKWNSLGNKQKTVSLKDPGLTMTIHGSTGAAELRPGKVQKNDFNYNRLVYNSAFLAEDDSPEGASAMTYSIKDFNKESEFKSPDNLGFSGERSGVIYRQHLTGNIIPFSRIDLADIILPGGVIRVDRPRLCVGHELHLGHFGLPHINNKDPQIKKIKINNNPGIIASIDNRQVALVVVNGWDNVETMEHHNKNPESNKSTVVYARRIREKDFSGMELLITIMLHRTDNSEWTEDELYPIEKIEYISWTDSGQPCGARLKLKDSRCFDIDYGRIEGNISW